MITIKRAYEPAEASDGQRVLVDRIWPRGVSKEELHADAWLRDLAPSTELRRWFNHLPERWPEFQRRYREELAQPAHQAELDDLAKRAATGTLTLVYGARDSERNQAVVLRDLLQERAASGSDPPADGRSQ
jgi:uncharacterized protein YeaO (DUF488 family)